MESFVRHAHDAVSVSRLGVRHALAIFAEEIGNFITITIGTEIFTVW